MPRVLGKKEIEHILLEELPSDLGEDTDIGNFLCRSFYCVLRAETRCLIFMGVILQMMMN
jgi:hypothetical protein